jgi:general secretion pathway protein G
MNGEVEQNMSKRARVGLIITIVVILIATLVPMYKAAVLKSREAVLTNNLGTLRQVIKQYTTDKQKAPEELQDLVDAGYFRQLPVDPMTNSNSTWEPVFGTFETVQGIRGVHSGSNAASSKGTSYRSW